jgi:carboxyl-terminal processing protease
MNNYSDFKAYNLEFELSDNDFSDFIAKAKDEDIEFSIEDITPNELFIRAQLKALIARNLYEAGDYFEVISPLDVEIIKALEIINDNDVYNNLLLN